MMEGMCAAFCSAEPPWRRKPPPITTVAQIRLQHQRLAERLHHDHGLDRAGAEAAVVFGERQAEQALLGELAPDGFAPAALLRHVLLARSKS